MSSQLVEALQRETVAYFTELLSHIEQLHSSDWDTFPGGYKTYAHMRTARKQLAKHYGVEEVIYLSDLAEPEPTAQDVLIDEFRNAVGDDEEEEIYGVNLEEFETIVANMPSADANLYRNSILDASGWEGRIALLEMICDRFGGEFEDDTEA